MMKTLLALGLIGGCVADVASVDLPTDGDKPPQFSEAALSNTTRTAFNYFVQKGLSQAQSAGIVGNLIQESSVSPTAVEYGGGPGRGIAQWSVGGRWDTSRNDNITTYAAAHGGSRWALDTQLDFMWYELSVVGGYGLPQLQAATTVASATVVFETKYELCGACNQSTRIANANQVLRDYGGTTTGGTTTPPPPTGETCYSSTLGRDMPENACVQSRADSAWYQCASGSWVDRWSDPAACSSVNPL